MKDILFSSGVGFGIGALFTIVRLPIPVPGNDSNLLIVFYVQIMPDDFVMQLHRF
ncbi:XapX domain-containing protein [Escherichia coli]|uniref:XapX domain-containing protein n=1 Tax=Escherichia coli TaxID=562 RepID=UPI001BD1F11E|nr:XapX domain-containing protein [Escherichia coli]QWK08435.1 XapX domain-containing protein [Escherichia coli]